MYPNGSIYKENEMGARINPWGTPKVKTDLEDEDDKAVFSKMKGL